MRLALFAAAFMALTSVMRADDYERDSDGDFTDGQWINRTQTPPGAQPIRGNPGGGDAAAFGIRNLTASAGSVMTLSGSAPLTVTGMVTAQNCGIATLKGAGTLNATKGGAQHIVGGHLNTQDPGAGVAFDASAGGSVIAATFNGVSFTGSDGSSLTVTGLAGPSRATLSTGSSLTANAGAQDLNLTLQSGSTGRVSNFHNGRSVSVTIDGGGSALTVDQQFGITAGFLDITNGGALTVNGQLSLDGGKDVGGNDIGGGGHWQGGAMISTSETMFVGITEPGGFSLGIDSGTVVRSGKVEIGSEAGSRGTVSISDPNTLWKVQSGGMAIGQNGTGNFSISNSAKLLFDAGTVFAVGLGAGSTGRVAIDGAGSSIDATAALVSLGNSAGGTGSIVLTNQASLSLGQDTFIGDGGSGNLSIGSGCQVALTGNGNTKFGVGNAQGSSGSISVLDGGNLNVDALCIVGVDGNGFVGVGNGGMVQSIAVSLGAGSGALGTVVVDGAGSIWNSSGNVFIGYANEGSGKWTVSSGGALNIVGTDPQFGLGELTGTTGELDVDGSGSQVTASRFIAGVAGTGTANVTNGGRLQTSSAAIGISRSSVGHVLVTDAGSQWTVTNNGIFIAGSGALGGFSQGGPGTLTVGTGGLVLVPRVITIGRLGNIFLTGGAVGIGTNANPAANTLRVAADGILTGSGRVQGQVIVAQGGQVLPGNSPGILTIDGDYEQDAGATYSAEIGGTDPGSGYDQINATGTATLGGNLKVRLTNGFTPKVGQTFRIVNASSVSGAFASISEPSQAGINLTSDSSGVTATITSLVDGAPVISGATTASGAPGTPFTYQIMATNSPTSFGATDLPDGLTVDNATGIISGTPTTTGAFIVPINANNTAGSGQADLMIISDPTFDSVALPPSNLVNISTRLNVQTGDNVLIGGFIITGTDPKKVLIRAIGPSLPLAGVLADPTLELYQGTTLLESNDNWMDSPNKQAIIDSTIPPTNPLESAIVRSVPPGNYTAIVRGVNNGTGTGVVEVYDLDTSANSKLANISSRGLVETGDNVLFAGTIVVGQTSQKVIVRALGPSTGVPGAMADPTLELHDGNGALLEANDNWVDSPNKQAIIDSTIPPTNNLESAIVRTLTPGNYTAIVRGANNSTGIAVVEVYALN